MILLVVLVMMTSPVCAVLRGNEPKSKYAARLPYKFKMEEIEQQLQETIEQIK